jgi:phage shock protein C
MAERFKTSTARIALDDSVNYTESDLKQAFESFIQEEPEQTKTNVINFTSVLGTAMMLMASLFFIGKILPGDIFSDINNWMQPLAMLGGVFVTIKGLGIFSRRRNRKKKEKNLEESPSFLKYKNAPNFASTSGTASSGTSFNTKTSSKSTIGSTDFERAYYDTYALKKNKKLYKSRIDKKVDGVCGGLAKYLGVSATVVRLIFIVATFMGYGSPILLYLGLSIALSKEPKILSDVQE